MLGIVASVSLVAVYIYIYIDIFTKKKNTLTKENKALFVYLRTKIVKIYQDMMYLCNFEIRKII